MNNERFELYNLNTYNVKNGDLLTVVGNQKFDYKFTKGSTYKILKVSKETFTVLDDDNRICRLNYRAFEDLTKKRGHLFSCPTVDRFKSIRKGMNIGDELTPLFNVVNIFTGKVKIDVNKKYRVTKKEEKYFTIVDDDGAEYNSFYWTLDNRKNFKLFTTIKAERTKKIEVIFS